MVGVFLLVVRSSNMVDLYARWTEPEAYPKRSGSDQLGPFSWLAIGAYGSALTLQIGGSVVAFSIGWGLSWCSEWLVTGLDNRTATGH